MWRVEGFAKAQDQANSYNLYLQSEWNEIFFFLFSFFFTDFFIYSQTYSVYIYGKKAYYWPCCWPWCKISVWQRHSITNNWFVEWFRPRFPGSTRKKQDKQDQSDGGLLSRTPLKTNCLQRDKTNNRSCSFFHSHFYPFYTLVATVISKEEKKEIPLEKKKNLWD